MAKQSDVAAAEAAVETDVALTVKDLVRLGGVLIRVLVKRAVAWSGISVAPRTEGSQVLPQLAEMPAERALAFGADNVEVLPPERQKTDAARSAAQEVIDRRAALAKTPQDKQYLGGAIKDE